MALLRFLHGEVAGVEVRNPRRGAESEPLPPQFHQAETNWIRMNVLDHCHRLDVNYNDNCQIIENSIAARFERKGKDKIQNKIM